jgi:hypothetical protein
MGTPIWKALTGAFGSFADFAQEQAHNYVMYDKYGPMWKEKIFKAKQAEEDAARQMQAQAARDRRAAVAATQATTRFEQQQADRKAARSPEGIAAAQAKAFTAMTDEEQDLVVAFNEGLSPEQRVNTVGQARQANYERFTDIRKRMGVEVKEPPKMTDANVLTSFYNQLARQKGIPEYGSGRIDGATYAEAEALVERYQPEEPKEPPKPGKSVEQQMSAAQLDQAVVEKVNEMIMIDPSLDPRAIVDKDTGRLRTKGKKIVPPYRSITEARQFAPPGVLSEAREKVRFRGVGLSASPSRKGLKATTEPPDTPEDATQVGGGDIRGQVNARAAQLEAEGYTEAQIRNDSEIKRLLALARSQ